ncbi:MAG: SRPBCC family protein [Acidobacteria bacterium]|nr:SRPBCC family protein [Acidobacteriota bacterium]
MDIVAEVDLAAPAAEVRPVVADLDRYPQWLSILARAEPESPGCWAVELRARVGPLARSKRLRMERTVDDATHLRFERAETDGRHHSAWTLDVRLLPIDGGTRLVMELHYGGRFGGGVVERLLAEEIAASRLRLRALVEGDPATP